MDTKIQNYLAQGVLIELERAGGSDKKTSICHVVPRPIASLYGV